MPETRTEWGARINYYDGTTKHTPAGDDQAFAEMAADSMMTHIESLNEPTRLENGVRSADVVSRQVTVEDDGTQIIRPWQVERAGVPVADEASA